eukprot:jgi/Astpho2/5872/Aster-x0707
MAPKLQLQLPRGQQRLQQIPRVRMCEEAWGSEAEESQGCLSEYLEELLDCGHEVLQYVPAHSKAVLAAVAKRKGLMDDEALRMLADEDWVVLDLAGCSNITAAGLAAVLPMLGNVAAVDLTACGGVRAATLRLLAASCPAVQELRLAPLKIEQLIQTKFTKVALNPPWKNTQALDQHLIDQLTPGCLEVQQEPDMEPDQSSSQLPSLAERFRMAYISRSQRIAAVMDRQYKREQRRRLRQDTVLQAVAKFNQQHR